MLKNACLSIPIVQSYSVAGPRSSNVKEASLLRFREVVGSAPRSADYRPACQARPGSRLGFVVFNLIPQQQIVCLHTRVCSKGPQTGKCIVSPSLVYLVEFKLAHHLRFRPALCIMHNHSLQQRHLERSRSAADLLAAMQVTGNLIIYSCQITYLS